jgi:hypothetical protein
MSALVESRSLEAEIADCCQALYWATEPEIAMSNWARLRELMARKTETEDRLFLLETVHGALKNRPLNATMTYRRRAPFKPPRES